MTSTKPYSLRSRFFSLAYSKYILDSGGARCNRLLNAHWTTKAVQLQHTNTLTGSSHLLLISFLSVLDLSASLLLEPRSKFKCNSVQASDQGPRHWTLILKSTKNICSRSKICLLSNESFSFLLLPSISKIWFPKVLPGFTRVLFTKIYTNLKKIIGPRSWIWRLILFVLLPYVYSISSPRSH